jgi:hypothetical protein
MNLGGDVAMPIMKSRSFLVALILFAMMIAIASAKAQSDRAESIAEATAPVDPPRLDIDESTLFAELVTHNKLRNAALLGYTEHRTYEVTDTTAGRCARRNADKWSIAGLTRRLLSRHLNQARGSCAIWHSTL